MTKYLRALKGKRKAKGRAPVYEVVGVVTYLEGEDRDLDWEHFLFESFIDVQKWYEEQLGRTFDFRLVTFFSTYTEAEIKQFSDNEAQRWFELMEDATDQGTIDICDPTKLFYMISRIDNLSGGMVGAENWGCDFVIPGRTAITGHMGRLLGDTHDPDWNEWWADERREACGGVAHEIGHALCEGMHHGTWEEGPSIMLNWWDFPEVDFRDREKERLLTEEVPTKFLS